MILPVHLGDRSYDVILERGGLARAGAYFNLDRKVLVVTDSGVPAEYAKTVANACRSATIVTVESGEASKSFSSLQALLQTMLEQEMTRGDCVVAVGGGVCGDLAGFAASVYMRGVDFYNLPTTLLSQVDSSIGGKTAINFGGVKNPVGSFYQPRRALIDPNVLSTLDARQFRAGLAEVIKMAAALDADLFEKLEREPVEGWLDELIFRSLEIKRKIVEADEREAGMRKLLNFGHTVGHAVEMTANPPLLHGECVAIGMLAMCRGETKDRLQALLQKNGLPTTCSVKTEDLIKILSHDKKATQKGIDCVVLQKIGSAEIVNLSLAQLEETLQTMFGGTRP